MQAGFFILFIGINLAAFILGNLIEIILLPMWLNYKPFNCRKCLTTHASWVGNTLVGLLIGSKIYIICGFLVAAIIYYLLDLEDKSQFE